MDLEQGCVGNEAAVKPVLFCPDTFRTKEWIPPPAQHENCELNLFGWQNEDYSSGDSISDSSEKMLQRGRGEGQYICNFGERGVHAIKHILFA